MRRALFVLCAVLACGCFAYAGAWFIGGQAQKDKDSRLAQQFHEPVTAAVLAETPAEGLAAAESAGENAANPLAERFERLAAINPDVVGWIAVEGTAIDYPVVRGEDNDYYLSTDFECVSSKHGSIFMDFRCTDSSANQIIYGHHMKDGTMFHDLALYQDSGFAKEHPNIFFYSPDGAGEVYRVVDVLYWDTQEGHDETFFETMTGLDYGEGKLISLTTCDNAARNIRIVVVAHMAS